MDWWIIKQLRAQVISDLNPFIPSGYFETKKENFNLPAELENAEYLSSEIRWGYLASKLGKELFYNSPANISARQISASEVLMNLGLLASAEGSFNAAKQISLKAKQAKIPDGNSGSIAAQLEAGHIPTLNSNISGALDQYLRHLTYEESKPYLPLFSETRQREIKSMNENTSKIINNTVTVSGDNNGSIQTGESNAVFNDEDREPSRKVGFSKSLIKWLMPNIGKLIFTLLSAIILAWLELK